MDGGFVTAPRWGLYSAKGEWDVENIGIAPDVEVEQDPALVRKGRDPQLEKAVEVVLEELKKNPPVKIKRPPYPDYKQRLRPRRCLPVAPAPGVRDGQLVPERVARIATPHLTSQVRTARSTSGHRASGGFDATDGLTPGQRLAERWQPPAHAGIRRARTGVRQAIAVLVALLAAGCGQTSTRAGPARGQQRGRECAHRPAAPWSCPRALLLRRPVVESCGRGRARAPVCSVNDERWRPSTHAGRAVDPAPRLPAHRRLGLQSGRDEAVRIRRPGAGCDPAGRTSIRP